MRYLTDAELREWVRGTGGSDADDSFYAQAIVAVEEQVHTFTGRNSFALGTAATARVFAAEEYDVLRVDDIGSSTGLVVKTDEDADGTYEVTLTALDFQTEPHNALGKDRAIERLRIRSNSPRYWPVSGGDALVEVTARWGWPTVPEVVRQAVMIQAARIVSRRNSPFGMTAAPEFGGERLLAKLDADVEMLLLPLQRNRGGVSI